MTDQASQQPVPTPVAARVPHFETTWLEGIVNMEARQTPDGGVILLYTLGNGHRYAIPLSGDVLYHTRRAVSPVVVAGANAMPANGHGTLPAS